MEPTPPLPTTKILLLHILEQIDAGPFPVAMVCEEAGLHPSCISRWKNPKCTIEPRLSLVEKLGETHEYMLAEYRASHPESA